MHYRQLRQVSINASLNRPQLLIGAERDLMIFTVLFISTPPVAMLASGGIGGFGRLITPIVVSVLLWLISYAVMLRMAKADPIMTKVYLRHRRYRDYYPAHSGISATAQPLPKAWARKV